MYAIADMGDMAVELACMICIAALAQTSVMVLHVRRPVSPSQESSRAEATTHPHLMAPGGYPSPFGSLDQLRQSGTSSQSALMRTPWLPCRCAWAELPCHLHCSMCSICLWRMLVPDSFSSITDRCLPLARNTGRAQENTGLLSLCMWDIRTAGLPWRHSQADLACLQSATSWVKLNAGQYGFYRVNYPQPVWSRLAAACNETSSVTAMPAADLAGLLDDSFALATVAAGPISNFMDFTRCAPSSSNDSVSTASFAIAQSCCPVKKSDRACWRSTGTRRQ